MSFKILECFVSFLGALNRARIGKRADSLTTNFLTNLLLNASIECEDHATMDREERMQPRLSRNSINLKHISQILLQPLNLLPRIHLLADSFCIPRNCLLQHLRDFLFRAARTTEIECSFFLNVSFDDVGNRLAHAVLDV